MIKTKNIRTQCMVRLYEHYPCTSNRDNMSIRQGLKIYAKWLPSDRKERKEEGSTRKGRGGAGEEGRMDGDGEKGARVVIFHHNPVTVE